MRVNICLKQLLLEATIERIFYFIRAEKFALLRNYTVRLRVVASRFPAGIPQLVITFRTYRTVQSTVS